MHLQLSYDMSHEEEQVQVGEDEPRRHWVEKQHEAESDRVVGKVNRKHLVPTLFVPGQDRLRRLLTRLAFGVH